MRVKIFAANNMSELEDQIDEFLKNKIIHDIKYSSLAIPTSFRNSVPASYSVNDRVMIMYDELQKDEFFDYGK